MPSSGLIAKSGGRHYRQTGLVRAPRIGENTLMKVDENVFDSTSKLVVTKSRLYLKLTVKFTVPFVAEGKSPIQENKAHVLRQAFIATGEG